jgi:hypothetical protein
MTIKHVFDRTTNAEKSTCMNREISKQEALKYFVAAELQYGSRITLIDPMQIRTYSKCFGSVDEMIFSGSQEEMAELVEIARAYTATCEGQDAVEEFFTQSSDQEFNRVASEFLSDMATAGKPFMGALWHMLTRHNAIPNAALKRADVQSAFELIYVDGQDPKTVFELADIQYKH